MQPDKNLLDLCKKNLHPGRVFPGVAIRLVPRQKTPVHSASCGSGFSTLVLQGQKVQGVSVSFCVCVSVCALPCSCRALRAKITYMHTSAYVLTCMYLYASSTSTQAILQDRECRSFGLSNDTKVGREWLVQWPMHESSLVGDSDHTDTRNASPRWQPLRDRHSFCRCCAEMLTKSVTKTNNRQVGLEFRTSYLSRSQ